MKSVGALLVGIWVLLLVGNCEATKILFGSTGGGMQAVSWNLAFENYSGVDVTHVQFFGAFADESYLGWQRTIMNQAAKYKLVPYMSLDPAPVWPEPAHPNVSTEVLRGDYDSFFDVFCKWLKDFLAGPDKMYNTADDFRIHMRFAHEFNIQPYRFDPPSFILMWRYVWKYFVIKNGIDNNHMQWHWCFSGGQLTYDMDRDGLFQINDYYPGDAYVDWMSYDAYNWGTVNSWGSWIDTANATHQYSIDRSLNISPNKPICIAETSTATNGGSIAKKDDWLRGLFPYLYDTNKVQMVSMFNIDADGADWVYFGNGSQGAKGTEDFTYLGNEFMPGTSRWKAFPGMKIPKQYIHSPNPSNPRVFTDAEFFGHLTTPANMCPGSPPCNSRGACDLLGKCTCIEGFAGADCSQTVPIPVCADPTCGGKGKCIDGQCVCLPSFWGCGSRDIKVYHNSMLSNWTASAQLPFNLAVSANPSAYNRSGSSISVGMNNTGYLYLSANTTGRTFVRNTFGTLQFYVYINNARFLRNMWVALTTGNRQEYSNRVIIDDYTVGHVGNNWWVQVTIPNSAFGIRGDSTLNGILFSPSQPTVATMYLDEIVISHQNSPPGITATTSSTASSTAGTTTSQATTSPSSTSSSPSSSSSSTTTPSSSSSPSSTSSPSSDSTTTTASPTGTPTGTTSPQEAGAGLLAPLFVLLAACMLVV